MQRSLHRICYQFGMQRRSQLHVFEGTSPNSSSGITATIYGATGFMGTFIGGVLGRIGSDLIFPHQHKLLFDDDVKELKLCSVTGKGIIIQDMDFHNKEMIDWTMRSSNVVINLLGPRPKVKLRKDFEHVNIVVPRRIAEAAAKNPKVIRLIHFSMAGARPDSESLDLQTRYYGEQEVLKAFPNATIIRPCHIVGWNDRFVQRLATEREFFHHFNLVYDDCKAKRQPILARDVAIAVLNALKLPETAGNTYELGGPFQYTVLEILEILHNYVEYPPKLAYFPKNIALKIAQYSPNWKYFGHDLLIKNGLDLVVSESAKKIDELYVRPVSFPQMLPSLLTDRKRRPLYNTELDER